MIQKSTLDFLSQLKLNNNREWFEDNRKNYVSAKIDFENFVQSVVDELAKTNKAYRDLRAKDCIFRIFRDVRFSKNKTPYKPNFGAVFLPGGRKSPEAGYYLHLEPGQSFIGGGQWMPDGPLLKAIRQEIDYGWKEWKKIVEAPDFVKKFGEIDGEKLKKNPKGYDDNNPAIAYLKLKSFTVGHSVKDQILTKPDFQKEIVITFKTMKKFIDFLNRAKAED